MLTEISAQQITWQLEFKLNIRKGKKGDFNGFKQLVPGRLVQVYKKLSLGFIENGQRRLNKWL